jgi:DNA repair exonuclease SbcCD ATPase subunit
LKKTIIDALKSFYGKDIEFRISEKRDKISEEIHQMFAQEDIDTSSSRLCNLIAAREKLEREIVKAKSELKQAKKKFRRGEMDRDELFDFEFRLIELRSQLEEIIEKIKKA